MKPTNFMNENLKKIKAVLVLTNKCNLACKYCYQNSNPKVNTGKEMGIKKWFSTINELAKMKIKMIGLGGGEPLISKNFWKILKYLSDKKLFYIYIYSNGILLDKKTIIRLKKLNVKTIIINVCSINKKTQVSYQKRYLLPKIFEAVKLIKQQGMRVEFLMPVTKKTLKEIDSYIPFCVENLKVDSLGFIPLINLGGARHLKKDLLNPHDRKILIKKVKKYREKYPKTTIQSACDICMAGRERFAIQPDGSLTPCVAKPDIIAGNAQKTPLSDIWSNSPLFKKIRNLKLKKECITK